MKVRCINNEDVPCLLTKNKIYEAKKDIKTWGNFYEIIADRGFKHTFSQKRFEEVKEMTYNEILMDFCTKKNDLINKALAEEGVHGIYYMVKEDFDEVKSWDEEICEKILEKLDLGDTNLCPWCLKRNIEEEKDCKNCKYGKRHGNCIFDSESTYKIICTIFPLSSIKGIEELFNQTKEQYKLLVEQEKHTEKPNPIEMKNMEVYIVEFEYTDSGKTRKRICRYFDEGCKKYILWLSNKTYCPINTNDFTWCYGKITKIVTNVTEMLYNYGIEVIEREYGCEWY